MVIEKPEDPLLFPVVPPAGFSLSTGEQPLTIGQFYDKIMKQIVELSKSQNIFTGNPVLQLRTTFGSVPLFAVTDEASALKALELIVDQGEGTTTSPIDVEGEPAHYYPYAEICEGYKLIPNPDHSPGAPPYIYGGAPMPFDPEAVWPVITNPHRSSYPEGSPAAAANTAFNQTYTALLRELHAVFNGIPDRIATALLNMQALHQQASYMMSIDLGNGCTAGPSFQYDSPKFL